MTDPDRATQNMIANLEKSSGRSFADWKALARASGIEKHAALLAYLKDTHGLTYGYANLVAHMTKREVAEPPASGDPIDVVFSGSKAALRPINDRLLDVARAFGSDVEVAPKQTTVSLRRHKQFACITPASAKRIELGIQVKGATETERLRAWPGGMTSHRVSLTAFDDVDDELIAWLRAAYDAC
jgi:hypothetical protein